jgi:outer membrane protein insertion porin family
MKRVIAWKDLPRVEVVSRAQYFPTPSMNTHLCVLPLWIPLISIQILPAQPTQAGDRFEGKKVISLRYDPPAQPLSSADLDRVQQLSVGFPYSAAAVGETIDRMFQTGEYSDIKVDAEPAETGVAVTFLTKTVPFVGHVMVKGKSKTPPNTSSIIGIAGFSLGDVFDEAALPKADKDVKDLFVRNGFYDANVHVEQELDPDSQLVSITIHVDPGKRARFEMPEIHGETKLPEAAILRATGWRVILIHRWKHVTEALTDNGVNGVKKKYQKKDRLEATVDLEKVDHDAATNRVKPTLAINAGPKIEMKALEAKIRKGLLKRYVPVYEEGATDNDLLVEGARNLRTYFQNSGYPDVEVTFRKTPVENDVQRIEYVIARGTRKKLVHVAIEGNRFFNTRDLRERIFLTPASLRFWHGRYSEQFRKRDQEAIAALYQANGFRDVSVTSSVEENYQGKENHIAVTYHIEEGAMWLVGTFHIEGLDSGEQKSLLSQLASSPGEPFAYLNVDADRNLFLRHLYQLGYPNASFKYEATASSQHEHVDLTYTVVKGRQEFVRGVRLIGLTRTRPGLVNRAIELHSGDPLSQNALNATQQKLDDLGVFARVDSTILDPDGDTRDKYVIYDVEEAHRYTMRLGIGAEIAQIGGSSTDLSAPAGGTGFSPRFLLNLSRIDFLGLNHTISFDGRISNLEQRAAITYSIPDFFKSKKRTLTVTTLYDHSSDVRTFTSKREEASIQLSQKLSKPTTISFRYAYRRVSVANIAIPDLLVPQLAQPVRIGIVSANLVQDRRNNPADAHHGIYNSIDVGVASNLLGSQRNFVRALGRNATYYELPNKWVIARQLTFGIIQPFKLPSDLSATDAIPLPERFFGGGNLTMRGFGENQAGPRDIGTPAGPDASATPPTGFPLGGNALFFHSTELRFPLLGDNIGGVFFHDMGNIYSSIGSMSLRFTQKNDEDFNYAVQAVGFGIRYKTPIGPIRADFAYSINPPRFVGFSGTIDQLLNCNPQLPASELPSYCTPVPQRLSHFQFFFSIGQTF